MKQPKQNQSVSKSHQLKSENQNLSPNLNEPFPLDSYENVVSLTGKIINGLLGKGELSGIARQDAHCIFVGTGYLTTALREARGGKMRMSVYLQDVHNQRINLENVPPDQIDRFLQGSEEIQLEVLQQIKEKDNSTSVELKPVLKKTPQPRLDTKLISNMSGVDAQDIKGIISGDVVDVEINDKLHHVWELSIGNEKRICKACGLEKEHLQPGDLNSICSGEWNLY